MPQADSPVASTFTPVPEVATPGVSVLAIKSLRTESDTRPFGVTKQGAAGDQLLVRRERIYIHAEIAVLRRKAGGRTRSAVRDIDERISPVEVGRVADLESVGSCQACARRAGSRRKLMTRIVRCVKQTFRLQAERGGYRTVHSQSVPPAFSGRPWLYPALRITETSSSGVVLKLASWRGSTSTTSFG